MAQAKFEKMLGFELRSVLYGSELVPEKPFVDLRRHPDGVWTVNAIREDVEYEVSIGKRWFRKNIPLYIERSLLGLKRMERKIKEDRSYAESVRTNTDGLGWYGR